MIVLMQQTIRKILIANRSEVSLRIQATCQALGITTVAIYCADDALARFVQQADEAYLLSGHGVQAYLNKEEIVAIALRANVQAVHPGYGFLAEQWVFAELIIAAGMIWIGPSPTTMRIAGDKSHARSFVRRQGVSVLDGVAIESRDEAGKLFARQCIDELGFPIIIKDAQAGGGKAMRTVVSESDFDAAWETVIAEGARIGCSGGLVIEKFITQARHIEVQVAGDGQSAVHYYERECSIQRKHQKIIEEAPCRFLREATIKELHQTAVAIAEALNYRGIGTVEFLVDDKERIYFLEINPRLQVEHSVTECIASVDLVALQIWLAAENPLPVKQELIQSTGHAIEVRIYAEDSAQQFMPSSGTISRLEIPYSCYLRVDHDLTEGGVVSPFFDPMIAKFTTRGSCRSAAINSMVSALQRFILEGVCTNTQFLQAVLSSERFVQGDIYTQLLANAEYMHAMLAVEDKEVAQEVDQLVALAAVLLSEDVQLLQDSQAVTMIDIHKNKELDRPGCSQSCGCRWKKQLWN